MGTEPDSVLDSQLRVRGVAGLRVADASALPRIPRANTNAPGDHGRRALRGLHARRLRVNFVTCRITAIPFEHEFE
jgi:hypothetical protein